MRDIEPLTEREYEILRLIGEGLTNQEIAEQLALSLGTIKWYNSQIYDKLAVTNRAQAIVRANELYLFDGLTAVGREPHPPSPNNLPARLTSFVGRQQELKDLDGLLKAVRLVTITGPAGIGKSRLAREFARLQLHFFADGIYFVQLAPLNDSENLIWTIAETLEFPFRRGNEPLAQLLDYLRTKKVLLILDNFEHLLEGAKLVPAILKETTQVKIIVTSRERLSLYGEVTYAIGGLTLPEADHAQQILNSDAASLFVQRATAVLSSLELSPEDLGEVGVICQLVEGMPLAIELAATWVDTLALVEIAREIERSLDILQAERRDTLPSQNSMRAAFLRSWNLLNEEQQTAFRRLAVFRGGFNREAALAISEISIQTLRTLVSKSLVRHDPNRGRYELHELLRYFAQEKLEDSGEAQAIHDCHANYFANFIDDRWQHTKGYRQHEAILEIEADIENIRSAWSYRVSQRNVAELEKFFHGLWVIHDVRGWHPAGVRLFEQAVEVTGSVSTPEARAGCGWLLAVQGMFIIAGERTSRIGFGLAQQGVKILRETGQSKNMVVPLISLFVTARQVGETETSVAAANDCLEIATRTSDQWGIVKAKQMLALRAIEEENYALASTLANEALSICEARGDRWSESVICIEVKGTIAILRQHYPSACDWIFRGLRSAEAIDFKYAMQMAYFQLGYIAILQDEHTEAARYWHRALKVGERVMGGFAIVGFFGSATTGDYKL